MKARVLIIISLLTILLLVFWLGPIVKEKFDFVSDSKEQFNITNKLTDSWETIGMYKDNNPIYDTIFWELNDDFDEIESSSYALWTDSGKYLHTYIGDSLINISSLKKVDIMDVDLSTGLIKNYQFVPGVDKGAVESFNQDVELLSNSKDYFLRIVNNDGSVDTMLIKLVTDSTLVLDWGDGYEERFTKRIN